MTKEELQKDIAFLLENPDKTLGSIYHDAGKCWELIEEMLALVRRQTAPQAVALGGFFFEFRSDGTIWMANQMNEGMELTSENKKKLEQLLGSFWRKHF